MIKKYFDQLVHNNDEFNEYLNATLDQDKITVTKKVSLLALFVVLSFGIVDILSATSNLTLILIIRTCMALNFVLMFYLTKQHKLVFLNQYHLLVSIAFLSSGFGLLGMILLSEAGGIIYTTYFAGLMLVIIALFSWFYVNTTITVSLGLLIVCGYIVVYSLKTDSSHLTDTVLLNNVIFLLASIAFGLIADIFRKHYLFKNFISQKRLIEFLLPKPNKEKIQIGTDVFLNKVEFQQSINNCIFDANTANLKVVLTAINFDHDKAKETLTNNVLNVLYQQSNHEIKTYSEGNTIWSLSFTKGPLETFKSTLETNIRRHLKSYKNQTEIKTALLEVVIENDFEHQRNQTIQELASIEFKTVSPNISLVNNSLNN